MKHINNDIEIIKTGLENSMSKDDMDRIIKMIDQCAKVDVVKEINQELLDFIRGEQFLILETDIKNLKKDCDRLLSKDEMTSRINILFTDLNEKL